MENTLPPLQPQSIADLETKTVVMTQAKFDEAIVKAMGRAAKQVRQALTDAKSELAVAKQQIAQLESLLT